MRDHSGKRQEQANLFVHLRRDGCARRARRQYAKPWLVPILASVAVCCDLIRSFG